MVRMILLIWIVSCSAHAVCLEDISLCSQSGVYYQSKGQASYGGQPIIKKINATSGVPRGTSMEQASIHIKNYLPESYHEIMLKVVSHESKGRQLAIGINSKKIKLERQPQSLDEAVQWSEALINAGYSIDMGYAQINSQHIKPGGKFYKLGITVTDLFDPRINLLAGAKIYGDAHNMSNGDIVRALSIYNTGHSERGIKNGYVSAVLGQRN